MKPYFTLITAILYLTFSSLLADETRDIQNIEKAEKLIKSGYEKALEFLIPLENESSSGVIENKIGLLYHFGEEIRDFNKAREWYVKAVKKGSGEAANHLGRLYWNGEGVNNNPDTALEWYKKGMELGDKDAKENYLKLIGKQN